VLPLAVSVSGSGLTSAADWGVGSFAREGKLIGGPILGGALAIGGAVMSFAVFEAAMLWVSRMPFVLAREHYLPASLTQLWSATVTPTRSILALLRSLHPARADGFRSASILDVFFYMAALALEMPRCCVFATDAESRRHVHDRRRQIGARISSHATGTNLARNVRLAVSTSDGQTGLHPRNRTRPLCGLHTQSPSRRYGGPPPIDPPPTSITA